MAQCTALYWEHKGWLYVRFARVSRQDFSWILQEFKLLFPAAEWQQNARAWKLPLSELQKIAVFTYRLFGLNSLQRINQPIVKQYELPWKT